MPFDFSNLAQRMGGMIRPEQKPGIGGGFVDPRGGINPAPPPMMPPKPGGFLGPMINNAGPMAPPPKPPMMARPMPPRPMGMAPRGTPPPRPGVLGTRRRVGMF